MTHFSLLHFPLCLSKYRHCLQSLSLTGCTGGSCSCLGFSCIMRSYARIRPSVKYMKVPPFKKRHKKTSSSSRTNCHAAYSYSVLSFLLPLPLFVPAFQQLNDQVLLLLFRKILGEKMVDALTLDIEFFLLVGLFLGENGKDDIHT